MSTFCFPDTTMICSYGSVGRIDLLEIYYGYAEVRINTGRDGSINLSR
ncbi:hypothetical protein [Kitasatospora sp. NPDC088779]